MGLLRSFQDNPFAQLALASPVLSLVSAALLAFVIKKIASSLQASGAQEVGANEGQKPKGMMYWLPSLGFVLAFMRNVDKTIARDRDRTGNGIFSYQLGPTTHYIVNMPSLVQQIFSQRNNVLSKEKFIEWFMQTTFDDKLASRTENAAFHANGVALNLMLKEAFIHEATCKTAKTVECDAARLITANPAASGVPNQLWEQAGKVTYKADGTYEASFYHLVLHYMGQIITDMLWGKGLMENFPTLQTDLWDFDEGMHRLVNPLLAKLTADGRRAVSARGRLSIAFKQWHDAVAAKQSGESYDKKWGALDDISQIMQDRVQVWIEHKASELLQTSNDSQLLWGVNVNSVRIVFLMLLQIYSRPEMLAQIRSEVAPYVKEAANGERGPDGFPKLEIDVEGLMKNCPVVKAASYETMRMNMSGLGIREVLKDITLKESAADAAMFGKSTPTSYNIPAGTKLVLASGSMQMDKRIFENPEEFTPERWIEEGPDGLPRANMKNLYTFGGGIYKCKGRVFAEREVVIFASSLLTMWDLAPAKGDKIVIPKMGFGAAARSPTEDIRVRLTRRFK